MLTAAVTSLGAAPLAGDSVSHGTSSDAVKFSVPPPVLDTVTVFEAGDAPPAVPLNVNDAGDTDSAGGGGGPVEPSA